MAEGNSSVVIACPKEGCLCEAFEDELPKIIDREHLLEVGESVELRFVYSLHDLDNALAGTDTVGGVVDISLSRATADGADALYEILKRCQQRRMAVLAPAQCFWLENAVFMYSLLDGLPRCRRFNTDEFLRDNGRHYWRDLLDYCMQDQRVRRFETEWRERSPGEGGPLEQLVRALFRSIPGFSARCNVKLAKFPHIEIDVLVENHIPGDVSGRLSAEKLGQRIYVECKDLNKTPNYGVLTKMTLNERFLDGCRSCFLVSPSGFNENIEFLKSIHTFGGFFVCLINGEQLETWISADDRERVLSEIILASQVPER
ncbi:MAG: hypothetical protein HZB26_14030 [Candidatus Hydrogenedentes bacterium]|nr:hypothetical protein [Candidatus Hydrogenedentota bacterium]